MMSHNHERNYELKVRETFEPMLLRTILVIFNLETKCFQKGDLFPLKGNPLLEITKKSPSKTHFKSEKNWTGKLT